MGSCTLRTLSSGACGETVAEPQEVELRGQRLPLIGLITPATAAEVRILAGLIENMCKTKTPNHKTLNPRPTRLSSENTRKADTDYVAEVALLRAEDHLNQTRS